MTSSNIALITGASTGIGKELAKIHAEKGNDVVIVARSQDTLNELKAQLESAYKVNVWVIVADLSTVGAAQKLFEQTQNLGLQIDILINNAGVGLHGKFHERELSRASEMMQINMLALSELTHLYLQGMVKRKQGKILNVSSTASFMPGPLQAVYYATKAYVTSFSQAVAEEVADKNVTVTALCPGPVATEFARRGELEALEFWNQSKSARSVAEAGYAGMEKGELISFNEGRLKFLTNWILPLFSRKLVLKLSRSVMEKTK